MKRDESTYGKVSDQYQEWLEIQAEKPARAEAYPPPRPYTPEPEGGSDVARYLFASIGFGLALVLLALAVWAFATAADWAGVARDGAFVGYTLVGVFLCIAGIGGIAAVWNHNFRVLTRPASHH